MQFKYIIGIDISKLTLDFCLMSNAVALKHIQIANEPKAIKSEVKRLLKDYKINLSEVLFCMEHTGIYSYLVLQYLDSVKAHIWLQSAIEIKRSMGMVRGKNDKVDSQRIALYALRNQDKLNLWTAPSTELIKLRHLLSLRQGLIKAKQQLCVSTNELKGYVDKSLTKQLKANIKPVITSIKKQITILEKQMMELINNNEELKRLYTLATSVPGVGQIVAISMIVKTQEFKLINEPKKLACYCGVVPFEQSSGTSLRSKPRVSHMADKGLKTLLHLAATSAIQSSEELRNYYIRKVSEGKSKMLVINAVRNKIIHRVYACINQNRLYEKNYYPAIA